MYGLGKIQTYTTRAKARDLVNEYYVLDLRIEAEEISFLKWVALKLIFFKRGRQCNTY